MGKPFFRRKGDTAMRRLIEEVQEWNTPVVGSYLLWQFTNGFVQNNTKGEAPIVIYHFIVSGILTEPSMCNAISGLRPNLASFIRWFNEEKKGDLLACLNQQIIKYRFYTMKSIDIAVSSGLLAWDIETAKLYPVTNFHAKRSTSKMGIAVHKLGDKAKILGKWFSECDLPTVAAYLGVIL
jgi:hypothetical protein